MAQLIMNKSSSVLALTFLGIILFITLANFDISPNNASYLRDLSSNSRHLSNEESAVIALLIQEDTNIDDLCDSLKSLVNIKGSVIAPVLAFHLPNKPQLKEQNILQACAERPVFFHLIDVNSFPEGFEPIAGKDYTNAQINRFWTSGIWKHTAVSNFDVVMKIDETSCFSAPDETLPFFSANTQSYKSHMFPGTVNNNIVRLKGMHLFALSYMKRMGIIPKHNELWQRVHYTFHTLKTVPNFQDSFEVVRKDFMLRDDVYDWLYALTDEKPYGYFTQGWNVNAERALTMSMFGSAASVDTRPAIGFVEKDLALGNRHKKICSDAFDA